MPRGHMALGGGTHRRARPVPSEPAPHTPLRGRRRAVGLTAVLLLGALAVTGSPARADPGGDALAGQIAAGRAQLAMVQDHAEVLAEHYDAARVDLATRQRAVLAAQERADRLAAIYAGMQGQARRLVADRYMSAGPSSTAFSVLTDASPTQYLERSSTSSELALRQAEQLSTLAAAHQASADATAQASVAAAAEGRVVAGLDAQRAQLVQASVEQQRVLDTLVARQQELVRQAQARAAAAAAAQRAAAAAAAAEQARQLAALRQERAAAAAAAQPVPPTPDTPVAAAAAAPALATLATLATPGPADAVQPAAPAQGPPTPAPVDGPAPVASGDAVATALSWARAELGRPYVWGAAGPSTFDCSGLTQYVYGKAGIALPHYTGSQWTVGRHIARGDLQPGDLVFFYSDVHHMGIYVGGDQMINAPHTGSVVQYASIDQSSYTGAVRVVG